MNNALAELEREYKAATGRPLDQPHLDIFDLGLDSMTVLELITRLRDLGYPVPISDFVNARSMYDIARMMAETRAIHRPPSTREESHDPAG